MGAAVAVETGLGELEIAASANANNVVVASNGGLSFSGNRAASFSPGTTGVFGLNDPSLARAASGNFYLDVIAFPNGTPQQLNVTGCTNAVSSSTNNGGNFRLQGYSAQCPLSGSGLCFPDQEHIAADTVNTATGGNDQLYATWRNFTPAGAVANCRAILSGSVTPSISCSQNNGAAWAPVAAIPGAGDFPRVAVGPAGDVYVVSVSGNSILLNRFASCSNGLTAVAGFPVTVATLRDAISCPIAGLDRCNNGNTMSSPTVAPDPDPANPNHVFVSFAEGDGERGGRIVVLESTDRGLTFPNRWVVSDPSPARRFTRWSCATSSAAWVGWYDRRAATATGATNDLTDYFLGSPGTANANLSNNPDPQCASGWPCAPRSPGDSDLCTVQPQLAGVCLTASGGGSRNRCDFDVGGCPAGETCQTGGGCPKYGDDNGLACAGNAVFAAWSSATPPLGVTAPSSGINVYGVATTIPAITVPNVVGLARSDAERVLAAAGLCFNASFPFSAAGGGSASGESPSAGTSVASRSTVDVAYASPLGDGIPDSPVTCPIAVPDIVGRGRVDAERILATAGVCFKASFPFSANGDGSATTESPPGGSLVVPSTVVAVAYPSPLGDGIPDSPVTCPIKVPDVIALNRSDAERTLAAAGLCFQANFPFNADGNGLATAENAAAGAFVLPRATVEVDYASPLGGFPPGPVTCP
jgi:beta-lactam-binding protein with PASTA domain